MEYQPSESSHISGSSKSMNNVTRSTLEEVSKAAADKVLPQLHSVGSGHYLLLHAIHGEQRHSAKVAFSGLFVHPMTNHCPISPNRPRRLTHYSATLKTRRKISKSLV